MKKGHLVLIFSIVVCIAVFLIKMAVSGIWSSDVHDVPLVLEQFKAPDGNYELQVWDINQSTWQYKLAFVLVDRRNKGPAFDRALSGTIASIYTDSHVPPYEVKWHSGQEVSVEILDLQFNCHVEDGLQIWNIEISISDDELNQRAAPR